MSNLKLDFGFANTSLLQWGPCLCQSLRPYKFGLVADPNIDRVAIAGACCSHSNARVATWPLQITLDVSVRNPNFGFEAYS